MCGLSPPAFRVGGGVPCPTHFSDYVMSCTCNFTTGLLTHYCSNNVMPGCCLSRYRMCSQELRSRLKTTHTGKACETWAMFCYNFYVVKILGSELRNWLLYFSLPVLCGVLPDEYLNHLSYLVAGLHILTSSSISPEDLSVADSALKNFYYQFSELYGNLF